MIQNELLIESTNKLIALTKIADWNNELLDKAPPVLWFGNSKSEKPKILTFGANPSRWEFLDKSGKKNWQSPLIKSFYETKYLNQNSKRFFHLNHNQCFADILTCKKLRGDILDSYDRYFMVKPYNWFGTNKIDSYNAEGFLRGFGASYYENNTEFRACHIDLFPFATITDFSDIQVITERDVFSNIWAKNIVDKLLALLEPKLVIVFGIKNFNYFCKYFNVNKGNSTSWVSSLNKGKCYYYITKYNSYNILGLSVNLGNPFGFDSKGLFELGEDIRKIKPCP